MAGRPTNYDEDTVKKAEDYLSESVPQNMAIPTVEGLALKLGVHRDTIYEWAKKHDEFSDTLHRLELLQKEYLTMTGIFGGKEINANIISLMLKVNHGMIETEKRIIAGDEENPLRIDINSALDKVYGATTIGSNDKMPEDSEGV